MLNKIILTIILLLSFSVAGSTEKEILLVISRGILPYYQAVDGFRQNLPGFAFKEYNLEADPINDQKIAADVKKRGGALILSVGPEAAYLVKDLDSAFPRVFTMVLNPEKILGSEDTFPGVSMNSPPSRILTSLRKAFPDKKRIGIFYSPDLNSGLIQEFMTQAEKLGLTILSFPISSSAQIQPTLKSDRFHPDLVLFVPDQAIVKEKIVHYIIEECLLRGIPSVGFNPWFARSGAVMAFYLDYREIGRQTAALARRILNGHQINEVEPPNKTKIILNLKIANKFNLDVSEDIKSEADQVIK